MLDKLIRFLACCASLLVAVTIFSFTIDLPSLTSRQDLLPHTYFDSWLFTLHYGLPALLMIPFALFFRDFRGSRFWLFLGVGSLPGPIAMYALAVQRSMTRAAFTIFDSNNVDTVDTAAILSLMTVVIFLVSYRLAGLLRRNPLHKRIPRSV